MSTLDPISTDRDAAARADAALLDARRRAAAARFAASLVADAETAAEQAEIVDGDDPAETVVFQLQASALGDIDDAGGTLRLYQDRLVLTEGDGIERGSIPIGDLQRVEVRRRFSTTSIRVRSAGVTLRLKGVRLPATVALRAAIAELRFPAPPATEVTGTADALRRLDQLAALGLVTDDERSAQRAALTRPT